MATVTPTGLPQWGRAAGHEQYGGNVNKRNHLLQGVVDAETDVSAQQLARLAADVAAMARVSPSAYLVIQCSDTVPADPTVELVGMVTGATTDPYDGGNPPAGFPTVTRVGDSEALVSFDTSYSDPYGVSVPTNIVGGAIVTATTGSAWTQYNSATSFTVRGFTTAGASVQDARLLIQVHFS